MSGKQHPKECPGMGGRASSSLPPAPWVHLGPLCCVAPPCRPLPLRSERVLGKSGPGGLGSGEASGKTVGALSPSLPPMRALQSLLHTPHTYPDWGVTQIVEGASLPWCHAAHSDAAGRCAQHVERVGGANGPRPHNQPADHTPLAGLTARMCPAWAGVGGVPGLGPPRAPWGLRDRGHTPANLVMTAHPEGTHPHPTTGHRHSTSAHAR